MAWRVPVQKRLFHVITTFVALFATISYFALATGDGTSFTHPHHHGSHKHDHEIHDVSEHAARQVFWARYIEWALTTPLILLDLSFLAGLDGANILVTIVADLVTVFTGLFAAYAETKSQKWGYYTFAIIAYLVVVYQIVVPGRRAAKAKDSKTSQLFVNIAGFTVVVWTLYPIVFGLAGAGRVWSVNAEVIAYFVLDVFAIPVFGFWLLLASKPALSLEGFWAHGLSSEGSLRVGQD